MKWIALALVALTTPVAAQNLTFTPKQSEAFSNLQMEYSVCIAYFNAMKSCAPKEKEADTARQLDPTIKSMTDMAYRIGKNIGMTGEAMTARLKMAYDDQTARMK